MSNEIGYGASAIKAGETRYQQAVANLLKNAAQKAGPGASTVVPTPAHVGNAVDITA